MYSVGMFVRINKSGERRYLQVVESYRNEAGQPRHRVVANLGRIDGMEDGHLDTLIRGLCRVAGRDEPAALEITHAPAKAFGDVFALHALWKDLGFDRALGRALRSGKRKLDVEALVRAMVFNRLCDPTSKLGCLRWLDTVAMPEMPPQVEHHHLLRAMDALMDNVDRVEAELAKQ
ncbi:IS1634 family transposase, partial [Meridianimarinicoccus aquatilis]